MVCRNDCHGGHTDHSQCDGSCDTPCTANHALCMEAGYYSDFSGMTQLAAAIAGYAGENKYIVDQVSEEVSYPVYRYLDSEALDLHTRVDHWCKDHCSFAQRIYGRQVADVHVRYSLSKEGAPPLSGDVVVGQVYVPMKDPIDDLPPVLDCKCHLTFATESWTSIGRNNQYGFYEGAHGDGGSYLNDGELSALQFEADCIDINEVQIKAKNTTGHAVHLTLYPDTIFMPESDLYQRMILLSKVNLELMPGETQSIAMSHGPFSPQEEQAGSGRLNCLDMDKEPPNGKAAYKVAACNDDTLRNLAWMAADEDIRGPWDQTRFWIYENKATYDHVRERLIPSPNAGGYLKCAWESAINAGVDFDDLEYAKLLEPKMLVGYSPFEAVRWLVKHLSKNRAAELASWVNGNASVFSSALENAKDDSVAQHIADDAEALTSSSSSAVRVSGLNLLMNGVPEASRKDVMASKAFRRAVATMDDEDEAVALKALDVVGAYKFQPASPTVEALGSRGPTPAIKDKATAVLALLKG